MIEISTALFGILCGLSSLGILGLAGLAVYVINHLEEI